MEKTWHEFHEEQLETLNDIYEAQEEMVRASHESADAVVGAIRDASYELSGMLDCRLGDISWQLCLQLDCLTALVSMMRSPAATQAEEWRLTAETLRNRRLLPEAETLFLTCLEPASNPLDYRTYVGLARTYELLGDRERALDYFYRSLVHAPASDGLDMRSYSLRKIGLIHAASSDWTAAREAACEALRLSPSYAAAAYDQARYAAQLNDEADALRLLTFAASQSSRFFVAVRDRLMAPIRSQAAVALFDIVKAGKVPATQGGAIHMLATELVELGEGDSAAAAIEIFIRQDPRWYSATLSDGRLSADHAIAKMLAKLQLGVKLVAEDAVAGAERKLDECELAVQRAAACQRDARESGQLNSANLQKDAQRCLRISKEGISRGSYRDYLDSASEATRSLEFASDSIAAAEEEYRYYLESRTKTRAAAVTGFDNRMTSDLIGLLMAVGVAGAILGSIVAAITRFTQLQHMLVDGAAAGLTPTPPLPRLPAGTYKDPVITGLWVGVACAIALLFVVKLASAVKAAETCLVGREGGSVQADAALRSRKRNWAFVSMVLVSFAAVLCWRSTVTFNAPSHLVFNSVCPGVAPIRLSVDSPEARIPLRGDCWSGWVDTHLTSHWGYHVEGATGQPAMFTSSGAYYPPQAHLDNRTIQRSSAFRVLGEGEIVVNAEF